MNLLAIDTSTSFASVALKVQDTLLQATENQLNKHAEWLLPAIDDLLKQANIKLADLDGIVYGKGPGSFTGLRVTCSVVKGLGTGAGLPVYPVGTLETIASSAEANSVLAMIDARMQAWYWAIYENGELITKEQVSAPAQIQLPPNTTFTLAGIGYEALYAELSEAVKSQITEKKTITPCAKEMILIVERGKIAPVSAKDAPLLYIREEVTHG